MINKSKLNNRDKTLSTSLVIILVTLLVMITIIFFTIYTKLHSQLLCSAYEHEQEHISNVCYAAEIIGDRAVSLLDQLSNNSNIKKLVYSPIPGSISIINSMNDFKEYITSASFITSAYILNQNHSLAIYTYLPDYSKTTYITSFMPINEFTDTDFCNNILSTGKNNKSGVFRSIPGFIEANNKQKVLTYYTVFRSNTNNVDGAFVLNVSIADLIDQCSTTDTKNQFIISESSENYYSDGPDYVSSDEVSQIISVVKQSGNILGQTIIHCTAGDILCSWNKPTTLPFWVISFIPYATITAQLKTTTRLIYAFYIGTLLISLSCILYFSHKAKWRIRGQENDFNNLSRVHMNGRKYVNDALVRSFLFSIEDSCILSERFVENGIPLNDFSSVAIIVIEINSKLGHDNPSHSFVKECIDAVITGHTRYVSADILQDRFVIILDKANKDMCANAVNCINALLAQAEKNTVRGVFDISNNGIATIPNIYRVLSRLINLFYFFPSENCIFRKILSERSSYGYSELNRIHPTLLQSISTKKYDVTFELLSNFFKNWFEDPNDIHNTLSMLLMIMTESVQILKTEVSAYFDYDEGKLRDSLSRCRSVDEVRKLIFDFVAEIKLAMNQDSLCNYVKQAKDIVAQKYNDQSLCIEAISDEIGISSSHLSALFKAETGISIGDFLRNHRLRIAAELLLSENDTIGSIAERVGYANATYFHAVFKKHYGVTPNEYRLLQQCKHDQT